MTAQKQLEVQIMGQSYLLGCPVGGEQRLLEAVLKVDTAMCKIRDAGKVKARDRIAVLAALNLAFDVSDRVAPASSLQASGFAASELPLNAALPAGVQASAETGSQGQTHEQPDARLAQLILRLDGALGDDGRLI
jgi:cell division protein ZapA